MQAIAALESKAGGRTSIDFDAGSLEPLARSGKVDAYVVATEDGFSPLGVNLRFLSDDLGIPIGEIKRLADWNRFENQQVSLVALPSRRSESQMRGAILAASETSESYRKFATPQYGRPHRDFYYNVTYEAIAYCVTQWRARRLAISHLSGSGRFHEDIATCNAEALAHYCDAHPKSVQSFIFLGCCIEPQHLSGISRLNAEGQTGAHRAIATEVVTGEGHVVVHLKWGGDV